MKYKLRNFPFKTVLVVCSVNTARSPMTVGFLKKYFKNLSIVVYSGGISSHARNGMLISMDAKLAMKEIGINLPDNSVSIDLKTRPEIIEKSELIITLTEKHKEEVQKFADLDGKVIMTLKEFAGEHGDIEDPSMKGLKGFRKVRNQIERCLIKGLKKYS